MCTPVHDRLGGRASVHDRLWSRTMLRDPMGGRILADDRLEQMANDRVQDDQPLRRDPEREPVHNHIDRPQWYPAGLTKSQKRRVQRLHQTELLEEEREESLKKKGVKSQVWRPKPRADDRQDPGSSAAPINMVLMLPPIQAVGSANSY